MPLKLSKYEGEGFTIQLPLKVNQELMRIVQQGTLDLGYANGQAFMRDVIYSLNKGTICQDTQRIPDGYPTDTRQDTRQETPDNQGFPVNQTPFENIGKLVEETLLDLPESINDTPKSISDLPKSKIDTPKSINDLPESKIDTPKSMSDLSQVEIIEEYVPEGISATQYKMYVRRLEDENVKLTDALKVCHKAFETNQKNGDLSAMLYQSEQAIHQTISWVQHYFHQFFPNQDVRKVMTIDVRKFHPNFPFYKT